MTKEDKMVKMAEEILEQYPKSILIITDPKKQTVCAIDFKEATNILVGLMLKDPRIAGTICTATALFYREHPELETVTRDIESYARKN